MHAISKQREIIDRRALLDELRLLAERLKEAQRAGYDEIRRRFEAGSGGTVAVREHCFLMDQLVRTLHDFVTAHVYPLANPTSGEHLAIVAVGGYGRGELAPHSDVD